VVLWLAGDSRALGRVGLGALRQHSGATTETEDGLVVIGEEDRAMTERGTMTIAGDPRETITAGSLS